MASTSPSERVVAETDLPKPMAAKRQPWRSVWPAPREPQSQANIYGFKKGEEIVMDGSAGNFFAKDKWEVSSGIQGAVVRA